MARARGSRAGIIGTPSLAVSSFAFAEVMAVGCAQRETVQLLKLFDFLQGLRGEGCFAFEGVEKDALKKVAKGHVLLFRYSFEDFKEPLFDAHTGLHALDFDRFGFVFRFHRY